MIPLFCLISHREIQQSYRQGNYLSYQQKEYSQSCSAILPLETPKASWGHYCLRWLSLLVSQLSSQICLQNLDLFDSILCFLHIHPNCHGRECTMWYDSDNHSADCCLAVSEMIGTCLSSLWVRPPTYWSCSSEEGFLRKVPKGNIVEVLWNWSLSVL